MIGIISALYSSDYTGWVLIILILIAIWKLLWYALAIYRALQKKEKTWFVILFIAAFVLNDLGILAIIYLLLHKDKKKKKK